jgi:hypothetical protein
MSTPIGSSQWMYAIDDGYDIGGSLRFNDNDNAYLKRDLTQNGNRKTYTISFWFKIGNLGAGTASNDYRYLYADGKTSSTSNISLSGTDFLSVAINDGTASRTFRTNRRFRDVSAWYHIVVAVDTTQVTDTDRVKIYINGQQETSFSLSSYPTKDSDTTINKSGNDHLIGKYGGSTSRMWDGYIVEFHLIDGTALAPTSFGEDNNGQWRPIEYSGGSYGVNGFYLDFSSGSFTDNASDPDVFADQAGSNDFNAYKFEASDIVLDRPTNNFCVFNALDKQSNISLQEGSLKVIYTSTSDIFGAYSTFHMTSGKWYAEFRVDSLGGSSYPNVGITKSEEKSSNFLATTNVNVKSGATTSEGTSGTSIDTFANGDILGVAFDADNGRIYFSKNGTFGQSQDPAAGTGAIFTGLTNSPGYKWGLTSYSSRHAIANFGQDSTFAGNETAGGNADGNDVGDFAYAPPSGFLALCTSNLPKPTFGPNSAEQADDYFNIVLYTGDGSASNAITGTNHQPDFLWIKQREVTRGHQLMDSVRGASVRLQSHGGAAEAASALVSFDSDGFTVDGTTLNGTNVDGGTFVAWSWKAGGAASTIAVDTYSSGVPSIASSVSAASNAGFSIVSWTGNGNNSLIGHGLNKAPQLIIVKNRDDDNNWPVYNEFIGEANRLYLDLTNGSAADSTLWNSTAATNQVFSVGTSNLSNGDTDEMIAYCFHSVDGFSRVGSYRSNNSTNGTFVYTGFRPSWVMIKRDASTDWQILDTKRNLFNPMDEVLEPNESLSTQTSTSSVDFFADFLSNGFKLRGNGSHANGGTSALFLYLAFAEMPFKYSVAR